MNLNVPLNRTHKNNVVIEQVNGEVLNRSLFLMQGLRKRKGTFFAKCSSLDFIYLDAY